MNQYMKHTLVIILLFTSSIIMLPQVNLTIEGLEIVDTETGVSYGYNVPRNQVTNLFFRNNSLVSVNAAGYMLQAGDEVPGLNNNHLAGALISGNKFTWNGTDEGSWTHSVFTGYNIDVVIKYNYLLNTPNGIQRKSNGMTDINGVVAYNIINNAKVGIVVKGMNGVRIYNNTLYCSKTSAQTGRGLIDVHTNTDNGLNAPSKGTKVFNNIFYTKNDTYCINVMDEASLEGFESDHNVFYCETGTPRFNAGGNDKTFSEWQALGYDMHSVIINPEFNNFTDFIPASRLNYGTDLGDDFSEGLAIDAVWGNVSPHTAEQNGEWQVGGRVYADVSDTIDLPQNIVKIYPNPAIEVINIIMTDPERVYNSFKIFDLQGEMVLSNSLEYGLTPIIIPENICPGIYTVVLEAEGLELYIKRIVIVN